MPKYHVRVSRAFWAAGSVEVEASSEKGAQQKALEKADDISLDWGDPVEASDLGPKVAELIGDGVIQEAFVEDVEDGFFDGGKE